MKKIPTIFLRDPTTPSLVLGEPHPDCAWVFAGEGVATRQYDGTCVLIENGDMFKRRMVKPGKDAPADFREVDSDLTTGKRFGWVRVIPKDPNNKWFVEAWVRLVSDEGHPPGNGTYELIGPKVQGNPEGYPRHYLVPHGRHAYPHSAFVRTYAGIRDWLRGMDIEGLVFHHIDIVNMSLDQDTGMLTVKKAPTGRMGKIKKRDFGFTRKETT